MLRTPQPKDQARLLAGLLGAQGFTLQHQKALDIIAQLHGHRDWNVMQAAPQTPPPAESTAEAPAWLERLLTAAQAVVNNADDTGCSDDLTVTSAQAIEDLDNALDALDAMESSDSPSQTVAEFTVAGFNVEDVLSVRPDLTDEEAEEVLHFCGKYFDASIGLNWDRIVDYSFQCLGATYVVEGRLEYSDGRRQPVVVELYNGQLHDGTLESIATAKQDRRYAAAGFQALPIGTRLVLGDDKVTLLMSLESDVCGASSDELHDLCDELREAGVTFARMPR